MSRHPDHDDIVGFVLGALERERAGEVSAHLDGCGKCTAEVRRFAPAVGVLAESVEQLEPPRRLREQIVETVRREAGSPPPAEPARMPKRRRAWRGGMLTRPAMGLAALALVAAAVGGYLVADGGDEDSATTIAAESPLPDAGGSLVVRDGEATLHVHGMPALEGRNAVYQVWVAGEGGVRASSSFIPHADGTATAAVPEAAEGATEVMVTREPGPGRTEPTLPTVLELELS